MNESTVWIWSQIDSCNELVICTYMYIYLVPASINYVFHQYLPSYMYAIGKWRFCLSIWLCRLGYDALRYISGRNISLKKKGRVADQTNKFFTDHCIAVEVIAHLKNSVWQTQEPHRKPTASLVFWTFCWAFSFSWIILTLPDQTAPISVSSYSVTRCWC